jgi:hypothetical protein
MKTKPKSDANKTAFRIVQQATREAPTDGKDPAAVSHGRRGGLKGGPARAEKLSKKRRAEIAQKAAQTRWKKHKKAKRRPS